MQKDNLLQLTRFSYNRQKLGHSGTNACDTLNDIIGVYSWHPSAPLSLLARVKKFTKDEFYRLDSEKKALRVPAMRLSNYILPAAWAFKVMNAVIPLPDDPVWAKRYSNIAREISGEYYKTWRNTILEHTKEPVDAGTLKKITGIPEEKVKLCLNRMAFEGDIIRMGSQSLRSNIISYVNTEAWTGKTYQPGNPDEALAWLAKEYLRAFGPARIKDFQWWAGVTMSRAKASIANTETTDTGGGYLLLKKDLPEFENAPLIPENSIDILPQWDSYTMGYAPDGRERFLNPQNQHLVYANIGATGGNGLGIVLLNGYSIAVWEPKFSGTKMTVKLTLFDKIPDNVKKLMNQKFEEIGLFLGEKYIEIK